METPKTLGSVVRLRRYPVKSMQGEELAEAYISERGVVGDRAYALMDRTTGHVVSAKHPRKWSAVIQCRAAYIEPPQPNTPLPPIWITLPDGTRVSSEDPRVDQILSRLFGRDVTLLSEAPAQPTREANRAPVDSAEEEIRQERMGGAAPTDTFFDYATIHVLTTATLQALQEAYPAGQFDVARFRPNIVVAPYAEEAGFVENAWLGQQLTFGEELHLQLIDPCPRCVITTLAQGELARDPGILRTIGQQNNVPSVTLAPGYMLQAVVGAYAHVNQAGTVVCGAPVRYYS